MIWNNSMALTTFRVDFTGEKSRDKNILMSQNERHNMKEGVCRLLLDTASQGSKWTMTLSWGRGGGGASLSRGLRCEFSPVLFFNMHECLLRRGGWFFLFFHPIAVCWLQPLHPPPRKQMDYEMTR